MQDNLLVHSMISQHENTPALTHLLQPVFDSPFAGLTSGDAPLCNDVCDVT